MMGRESADKEKPRRYQRRGLDREGRYQRPLHDGRPSKHPEVKHFYGLRGGL